MGPTPRRETTQRSALRESLSETSEFITAQELHSNLQSAGYRIGLATVYRTLAEWVAVGEVDTLRSPAGETLYRQCGESEHHHHLVCRVCGRTEEVTALAVERWARTVAKQFGFVDINHEVEIFGLCAGCADSAAADGAASASATTRSRQQR